MRSRHAGSTGELEIEDLQGGDAARDASRFGGSSVPPARARARSGASRARLLTVATVVAVLSLGALWLARGQHASCPPAPRRTPSTSPAAVVGGPADRYVATGGDDTGPGTAAAPWRTLQRAADAAAATVWIRGGTYAGFRVSRPNLRFVAHPGEAVVVARDPAGARDTISVAGAHGILLANITVRDGAPTGAGIRIRETRGAVIEHVVSCANAAYGIRLEDAPGAVIRSSEVTANAEGVYVSGTSEGTLIQGNDIHDNDRMVIDTADVQGDDHGGVGVAFVRSTGSVTASGNRVWRNRARSHDYGYDGGAFEIFGASDVSITANRIWDNKHVLETGTDGPPCERNVFTRNVAWGASSVSGYTRGLLFACMSASTVAHNVLDGFDVAAVSLVQGTAEYAGAIDALTIVNNVFVSDGASVYYLDDPPDTVTLDHNVAWNRARSSVAFSVQAGNTNDWDAFRSWYGYEPSGAWRDPRLRDPASGDYVPREDSPAIDRGVVVPGVTGRYLGDAPDAGATEVR